MGGAACKPKLVRCLTCTAKKSVKPKFEDSQAMVIKEVYVLFMIFDYLPFPDLIRSSQISRGLYWLSGNQLLLFKF